MPKEVKELSGLAVSRLKSEGIYAVGGVDGLYLHIRNQSRAWVLCVAIGTRINNLGRTVPRRLSMSLGPYPEVSLAKARDKARGLCKRTRNGINPLQEKHEQKARQEILARKRKTFTERCEEVLEVKDSEMKNKKHLAQWRSTPETYAYPFVDKKAVSEITRVDLLAILGPIWLAKNETTNRLHGRIEAMINYAKAKEYLEGDSPAAWKGMLKPFLPQPSKIQITKHHAALPYNQIGSLMEELHERGGISPRALEFAVLTATHSGEIRGAEWSEIDLEDKTWTTPASRMKATKEHRVPLFGAAAALLKVLSRFEGINFVFSTTRKGQPSDTTSLAVLKQMGYTDLTQHGFRSIFRDWAGEATNYPREVIEHALAHQLANKTEAAHQRGTLWPKQVALMDGWAGYCIS